MNSISGTYGMMNLTFISLGFQRNPEEKESRTEKCVWNGWNLLRFGKTQNPQVWKTEWSPNRRYWWKSMPRNITVKLVKTKNKERIFKAVRGKHLTYRGKKLNTTAFTSETLEASGKWHNAFQMLKELSTQKPYPAKIYFKSQDILDKGKAKSICQQQTYSKRVGKEGSWNRKEMIKQGLLEYQKGRNNRKSKNVGK